MRVPNRLMDEGNRNWLTEPSTADVELVVLLWEEVCAADYETTIVRMSPVRDAFRSAHMPR